MKGEAMIERPIALDDSIDLVYSPDDGAWYLQRFPEQDTSQLFDDEQSAREAWANPEVIVWS